jgi:hypothetical protein
VLVTQRNRREKRWWKTRMLIFDFKTKYLRNRGNTDNKFNWLFRIYVISRRTWNEWIAWQYTVQSTDYAIRQNL